MTRTDTASAVSDKEMRKVPTVMFEMIRMH